MAEGLGNVSVMRRRGMKGEGVNARVARVSVGNARDLGVTVDGVPMSAFELASTLALASELGFISPADARDIRRIDVRFWYWNVLNCCGD